MKSCKVILYGALILFVFLISACSPPGTKTEIVLQPTGNSSTISTATPTPIEKTLAPEPPAAPTNAPTNTTIPIEPKEAAVQRIPLDGALSLPEVEISGMAWYGDKLIILPQYPDNYRTETGLPGLFAISKSDLLDVLDGEKKDPIGSIRIPINNTQVAEQIPGYEGFEAIAINGDQVYLAIEANYLGEMKAYFIQGSISQDGFSIDLNPDSLLELELPAQIFNAAFESLVVIDNQVLALFEANGHELNPEPKALKIDPLLGTLTKIDSENFEYRFTDATKPDSDGNFWVLNVFVPIEFWYYTNSDPISEQFGKGKSHQGNNHVERLLELKYNDGKIQLSGKPPLYIELIEEASSRNWEAITRLDERGFLVMSDTYPGTILGFIPFPES